MMIILFINSNKICYKLLIHRGFVTITFIYIPKTFHLVINRRNGELFYLKQGGAFFFQKGIVVYISTKGV